MKKSGDNRLRDVAIVAASALLLVLGAAAVRKPETAAPPPAASRADEPLPPLPSGAPPRDPDAPLADAVENGCSFVDRGFGDYAPWRKVGIARVLIPQGRGLADDGSFRLLVHFHGAEPIRRLLAPEGFDLVIAAVDAGISSGAYGRSFSDPAAFAKLLAAIEAEVASENQVGNALVGRLFLSSWSAGYGALGPVLRARKPAVDALILLDSLHASYRVGTREVEPERLQPFVEFARIAGTGGPLFFLSHTLVPTPSYASTAEVASFVVREAGTEFALVEPTAGDPMRLFRLVDRGGLQMRGYGGADRAAHCAQLRELPRVLKDHVFAAGRR